MRRMVWSLIWMLVLAAGCGVAPQWEEAGFSQSGQREATRLILDFPGKGRFTARTFYNMPYPHDLRLEKDGTPDLTAFPAPKRVRKCPLPSSKEKMVKTLLQSIDPDEFVSDLVKVTDQQARGFGLNSSIYLRFTRPLSPANLPGPAESIGAESPVFLMDIDPQSPQQGRRIPLLIHPAFRSRFLPSPMLVARPLDGFPLRVKTRYAFVVLRGVRDDEGQLVEAPLGFGDLASSKPLADPAREQLRAVYAPMFAYLKKEQKIKPDDIVAATVFTTGEPIQELRQIRKYIRQSLSSQARTAKVEKFECTANSTSTPYVTCTGTFPSPQFQKGTPPFLDKETGFFHYDKNNTPQHRMERLRFALSIPKQFIQPGALAGVPLPVVMYAHGTGGNYKTFLRNDTAETLARMGIAVFGIDQAVNGERTLNLGGTRLDFLFFNALNIPAARDNVRQSAIDYYWQLLFLKDFSFAYKKQKLHFDSQRIWFMGHSQGGLTGPVLLGLETEIRAAFLSAPGGSLVMSLLYKTEPAEPIQIPKLIDYMLCDLPGSVQPFHPIISQLQNFFEPADPMNYAPYIFAPSRPPLNLLMTEGLTDHYAPPAVFDPLAVAMGLPLLGPQYKALPGLTIRSIPRYPLPARGNYLHPSGVRATIGFTQHKECKYASGNDCDGHFVAFNNPNAIRNWTSFFRSMLRDGIATIR